MATVKNKSLHFSSGLKTLIFVQNGLAMTTNTLHLPLRDLSAETIRDLQEKYPEADIEMTLHRREPAKWLHEEDFWDIIAQLDWSQEGNDDAVLEPAVAKLANMPVAFIYRFADLLSEKLSALDTTVHAENAGEQNEPFSADEFLYIRCCVIANGKEYYEAVLKDPMQMPRDMDFEPLLHLVPDAYRRKTGKEFAYVPTHNFETGSNQAGWK